MLEVESIQSIMRYNRSDNGHNVSIFFPQPVAAPPCTGNLFHPPRPISSPRQTLISGRICTGSQFIRHFHLLTRTRVTNAVVRSVIDSRLTGNLACFSKFELMLCSIPRIMEEVIRLNSPEERPLPRLLSL